MSSHQTFNKILHMKIKHENHSKRENYKNELTFSSTFEFLLFGLFILVFKCQKKVFIRNHVVV